MKYFLTLSLLLSSQVFAKDLTVIIKNIRSNNGFIRLAMYNNATDFPDKFNNAIETMNIPVTGSSVKATIKNLKSDTYAIAVFHDENNNEDLDTSRLGIPKEPFGFSNNPRLFGPPTFRKCKFKFSNTMTKTINLKRF